MVMVWLEGGQGEVRGACAPPPPPTPQIAPPGPPPPPPRNAPLGPPPQPTLPEPPAPPIPPPLALPEPPLRCPPPPPPPSLRVFHRIWVFFFGGGGPKGLGHNLLMQFSSLCSSKMEISETDFFNILPIHNDQIPYVKNVLDPLCVRFHPIWVFVLGGGGGARAQLASAVFQPLQLKNRKFLNKIIL